MSPRAGQGHIEVEGARVLAGKLERVEIGGELGGGSGVTAGGIGGGELGHEEVPGGGPGGTDGGDEELGREGVAPEELGDGGEWLLEGHSRADVGSGGGEANKKKINFEFSDSPSNLLLSRNDHLHHHHHRRKWVYRRLTRFHSLVCRLGSDFIPPMRSFWCSISAGKWPDRGFHWR